MNVRSLCQLLSLKLRLGTSMRSFLLPVMVIASCTFSSVTIADDPAGLVAKRVDGATLDLTINESMDGWEGPMEWFRFEDGVVVAGSLEKEIPHNQFLCSENEYADFELSVDIKLVGPGQNAGVQIRSQRMPESNEVIGYQADAGIAWDQMVWGGLYDESRRQEMLSMPDDAAVKQAVKPDDWNRMKIVCIGSAINIFINGKQITNFTETDDEIPRFGKIALQIHSGPPSLAMYKNLKLIAR